MPYLIQFMRDITTKIADLNERMEASQEQSAAAKEQVPTGLGMGMGMIANAPFNSVTSYNGSLPQMGMQPNMQHVHPGVRFA